MKKEKPSASHNQASASAAGQPWLEPSPPASVSPWATGRRCHFPPTPLSTTPQKYAPSRACHQIRSGAARICGLPPAAPRERPPPPTTHQGPNGRAPPRSPRGERRGSRRRFHWALTAIRRRPWAAARQRKRLEKGRRQRLGLVAKRRPRKRVPVLCIVPRICPVNTEPWLRLWSSAEPETHCNGANL
jgi:hypothetical protein